MRHIQEEQYTLRKMASLLGVSTGMIYKIETIFGLRKWGSSIPGKKSLYSSQQMEFFHKIIFLSNAGIRLVDIKPLFELENKICSFVKVHFPMPQMGAAEMIEYIKDKTIDKKWKARDFEPFLIAGLYCPEDGVEYDSFKFENDTENANKLRKLLDEYTEMFGKMAGIVNRRYDLINKNLRKMNAKISGGRK